MSTGRHPTPGSPRQRRRLAWLLVLALLLPFAQALAWTHALTHHTTRTEAGAAGQFDTSCATCLGASALHTGAPPAAPPLVAEPLLQHSPPPPARSAAPAHDSALAYSSRAPPRLS